VQILLCRKSIDRLGPDGAGRLTSWRDRGDTPGVKDVLDRCQRCQLGLLIATVGGMPLGTRTTSQLLIEVDAIAAAADGECGPAARARRGMGNPRHSPARGGARRHRRVVGAQLQAARARLACAAVAGRLRGQPGMRYQ